MDEALKYGFRRVTPMDDCSDQFQGTFKKFPNESIRFNQRQLEKKPKKGFLIY